MSRNYANLNAYLRQNLGLSKRQAEVAILVTKGLSNRGIGNLLFITERSVRFHLEQIYILLGVKSRAELIVTCLPYLGYVDKVERIEVRTKYKWIEEKSKELTKED